MEVLEVVGVVLEVLEVVGVVLEALEVLEVVVAVAVEVLTIVWLQRRGWSGRSMPRSVASGSCLCSCCL